MKTKLTANEIGMRLKAARERALLTENAVVIELGCIYEYVPTMLSIIQGIEAGEIMPSDAFLVQLCDLYEVDELEITY